MEMDDQELQKLVDWAIGKYFQAPPYVLRGSETVTADDNAAIYEVLTLKAALKDDTAQMDDDEIRVWVAEAVRDIYYDARTYEDAVMDLNGPDADEPFKQFAIGDIPYINFSRYPTDESGDYRFNQWVNAMYEEWLDHGRQEYYECHDRPEM